MKIVLPTRLPSIEYKKYYESIDPTNAEIYRRVVEQLQYSMPSGKADIYKKMKPDAAARILKQ